MQYNDVIIEINGTTSRLCLFLKVILNQFILIQRITLYIKLVYFIFTIDGYFYVRGLHVFINT